MGGSRRRYSFGERLVALLRQEGVEAIFSQGDLSMKDIQLHAEREGLSVIGPRHEASGVFMAMGHYALTGRPQVAIGATGPGAANLLPAAVAMAQEHVPVVLLGASRQRAIHERVRRDRWLHAPLLPAFERICKYAARVDDLERLDEIVQEAFRHALIGTPGPVYIEYDLYLNERSAEFGPPVPPGRYRATPAQPAGAPIRDAVALLTAAQSPLIVAGEGVHRARAHEEFRSVVERLGGPVLTTIGGAGVIPETDPHWLDYMSDAGGDAIAAADLILAVGTAMPETFSYGRLRRFASGDDNRKLVSIEPDPAAVGVNRPADLALVGDTRQVLSQLAAALPNRAQSNVEALSRWRDELFAERQKRVQALPTNDRIHPGRLMLEARRAVPDEAVIVVDGGLTMLYQHAFFEKRGNEFVYAANFAHLGSGLGLAIGAQLAAGRDAPVCLLTGDGALGFHLMEFEVAVRHALPIVVVVNDDQAFGAEMAQHMRHIGHEIEVALSPVDYAAIAEAMGGFGLQADTLDAIEPAIRQAFAARKPALVQVRTDPEASHRTLPPYVGELAGWKEADLEEHT